LIEMVIDAKALGYGHNATGSGPVDDSRVGGTAAMSDDLTERDGIAEHGARAPSVADRSGPLTTKADEIARSVEEMIVAGRLQPDQVLRQDDLSRQFGVSRTPVREAFRQLAALGLVSFVPNRGVRVRALDQDEWGQAFLARAALEAAAAHRAASRMTEADLRRIDEANEDFRHQTDLLRSRGLTSGERERASLGWIAANDAFHEAILGAAQVPLIGRLISGLRRVFSGESMWAPGSAADQLYQVNVRQHDAIRHALAAGSADAARTLAHDHVLDSWEMLKAVLAEAPISAQSAGRSASPAMSPDRRS
jgi:DNA-binding GntR family transcriptional regulator